MILILLCLLVLIQGVNLIIAHRQQKAIERIEKFLNDYNKPNYIHKGEIK